MSLCFQNKKGAHCMKTNIAISSIYRLLNWNIWNIQALSKHTVYSSTVYVAEGPRLTRGHRLQGIWGAGAMHHIAGCYWGGLPLLLLATSKGRFSLAKTKRVWESHMMRKPSLALPWNELSLLLFGPGVLWSHYSSTGKKDTNLSLCVSFENLWQYFP